MNQQPQFDLKKLRPIIYMVIAVIFLLSVGKFWVTIDSGYSGVLYRLTTGVDVDEPAYGQGLHITKDGEDQLLAADTGIVCAGQGSRRGLADELEAAGRRVHVIGGADKAVELDAQRAIDQGARLAAVV